VTGLLNKCRWSAFALLNASAEAGLPYWPIDRIMEVQRWRIRAMVDHAYRHTAFYRAAMDRAGLRPRDFHSAEDLARLPLLSKDDLERHPRSFRATGGCDRVWLSLSSSGTGGQPISVDFDRPALFLAMAHGHRQRLARAGVVGRSAGYRDAGLARPGSLDQQIRGFFETHSFSPAGIDLKRLNLSVTDGIEHNLARLQEFRPHTVHGYGSYIGALFRWAHLHGHRPIWPKAISYGADILPAADRKLIEAELGIPVFSTYQATEALRIGFQCEQRQGFHLSLDQLAIRVIDGNGNPVGPGGTGEIVISNLTNRATVLLNYRLGDMVTLGQNPCPCGRTLPTIESIDGRINDLILLPNGEDAYALPYLEKPMAVPGVVRLQLVQQELRRFHVRIVYAGADWPTACAEVRAHLKAGLGDDIELGLESLLSIPAGAGGKVRTVVCLCRR
jgi:phenylacetate-CoA ligase